MTKSVHKILERVDSSGVTLASSIIVHCRAGVSRSAATAWLILIKLGMDYKDAFTLLYKKHPGIWPNTVVLSIGAMRLGLPKEFNQFVDQVNTEIGDARGNYQLGYGG